MGVQELLQAASTGSGVAQVLARALLAAGGDLSGVSSDGRPMALMPDVKVCCDAFVIHADVISIVELLGMKARCSFHLCACLLVAGCIPACC